jgi:hypothetical protein
MLLVLVLQEFMNLQGVCVCVISDVRAKYIVSMKCMVRDKTLYVYFVFAKLQRKENSI